MIEASQRTLRINSQGEELEGMSPTIKKHLDLETKTLQLSQGMLTNQDIFCK